ncbi:flavodoxin domain-containing protein [Weissella tructae]|uniref:Probabale flavodoxin n=2 Tax=Weissella TaxID=46255 RepID=A0A075U004_9LACO|nr:MULTISPECIES: flavodoxin domain-containing protein [Weissella]AIG65851.1 Probabale flavodoxin [Weissella tructae]AIM63230.1 Probabale flavodoxin [Weissella ceti]AIM64565.1 Probabale flavodoxin [Weissella ceti]ELA07222.1 flavodoxin [Weissella ceti NC36]QVV91010.1 flavodoxin domain-containing protein [Weissella tructae]
MKARVMFATITGNNEAVADIIVAQLRAANIETIKEDISLVDALSINPAETDFLVVVPYTFDLGTLPEEALDFYEDLVGLDFSGLTYAVAGSGDDFYGDDFCTAVDEFDKQLAQTQAQRGAENVKVNLNPDATDAVHLAEMVQALIATKA